MELLEDLDREIIKFVQKKTDESHLFREKLVRTTLL
jgi:hypothetical protein